MRLLKLADLLDLVHEVSSVYVLHDEIQSVLAGEIEEIKERIFFFKKKVSRADWGCFHTRTVWRSCSKTMSPFGSVCLAVCEHDNRTLNKTAKQRSPKRGGPEYIGTLEQQLQHIQ